MFLAEVQATEDHGCSVLHQVHCFDLNRDGKALQMILVLDLNFDMKDSTRSALVSCFDHLTITIQIPIGQLYFHLLLIHRH